MARFECWLGENIIAEGDTLDELRGNLEWQVDENTVDAVECYDTMGQLDIDVYELLGISLDRILEEIGELVKQSLR